MRRYIFRWAGLDEGRTRRSPWRAVQAVMLAVLVAVAGLGCEDTTGPDVGGTYTLDTVNGSRPPVTIFTGTTNGVSYSQAITSGQLALRSDGTFTVTLVQAFTTGGSTQTQSDAASGTWTSSGGTVTLYETGQPPDVATISGNSVTFSVPLPQIGTTLVLVFKK